MTGLPSPDRSKRTDAAFAVVPRVALVGGGPGDPGLLTLRGAELLHRCDVVLYDGLSNATLLSHAAAAEHICVGKHGQSRIWTQQEIIDEMLRHARRGRRVVRLKGGDPAVFARTSEEVAALKAAGIDFEIVPGITAALAAGSFAGIPITHRGLASAVALVTGHEEPGKPESDLDWDALARFPGTLVVYMGVTTAREWTQQLIAGGKSPDTPAAIIRRCSLPDQQTVTCTLGTVADRLTPASKMRPPVIVIIGPVAELGDAMSWFDRRPLFGQTVLVTRPCAALSGIDAGAADDELGERLRAAGAMVVHQPLIQITPPSDWDDVDRCIDAVETFDTLIFCSRNGVDHFMTRLLTCRRDVRCLASVQIAAVGPQTAAALAAYHVAADWVPDDFRGRSLATHLCRPQSPPQSILIVRADRGASDWVDDLQTHGHTVRCVAAYRNTDVTQFDSAADELMRDGKIDWITVTSSAIARNLHRQWGTLLDQVRLASLSPVTSATLRELGHTVAAQADPYTMESLVQAIRTASPLTNPATGTQRR